MRKILKLIANEIKGTANKLIIAGHTDARAFHNESYYSNWELSAARALNTRRNLEEAWIPSERFEQVVGYADRKLRVPNDPLASENRRISILIKKIDPNDKPKGEAAATEVQAETKAETKSPGKKSASKSGH
jgi:chemotaxis protein MotB